MSVDPYKALAYSAHIQTEAHAEELEEIANKQEDNLGKKKDMREVQKYYDKITADDVVEFDELQKLHDMREWIGSTDEAFWEDGRVAEFSNYEDGIWHYDENKYGVDGENGDNSHWALLLGDSESEAGRKTEEIFDNIKSEIENSIKDIEDVQSQDQFEIQMATSDLQNAETERRQAYQKMAESRKQGNQVWGQS